MLINAHGFYMMQKRGDATVKHGDGTAPLGINARLCKAIVSTDADEPGDPRWFHTFMPSAGRASEKLTEVEVHTTSTALYFSQ